MLLLLCSLGLGAIELALVLPTSGQIWWVYVLFMIVFWVYVGAGTLAWHRRPSNNMGRLIVIGGLAVFAGSLANTGIGALMAVGTVCATIVLAVTIHLLHAFPSGRVHGRLSRATVIAAYVTALVLQAPLYLFDSTAPPILVIADRPDLVLIGGWVQRAAGIVIVASTMIILGWRLAHVDASRRRVLAPLFAYGMLAVLVLPLRSSVLEPLFGLSPLAGATLQFIIFAGIPIAFTLGVLRGGFARTGELQELSSWLGETDTARPALAQAVARALGDNSIEIVFWVPERSVWVDATGALAEVPDRPGERSAVEVLLAGQRVGAIVYDAGLIADPELVRTAGRVIAIAVERERLLAELLASQAALLSSRARLVAAADRERRRIARDLHDGLQVQLVLLAIEAQQIAAEAGSPADTAQRATTLRKGIDAAAGELRRLVHDVMPATLIQRGLSAATEDLVDRMPVPTKLHLRLSDGALPETIESTAYFLIAEGLVNALKHSKARSLAVLLERDGNRLLVEVHDDGIGGASFDAGRGLRGLADRVDVAGGRLRLHSEPGHGTRLTAELPCA